MILPFRSAPGFSRGLFRSAVWTGLVLSIVVGKSGSVAMAQPFYQPLNQNMPTGVAAYWAGALGKATPPYFQPVRVNLPTEGQVTVYHGPARTPYEIDARRPFAFLVGHTYRFRIAGMPEYPGLELYPSVEILDRLHPPPGQELKFPIPLELTEREIATALEGRLVTKVVFLEQPQLAPPAEHEGSMPTTEFLSSVNILAEADRAGRPMAILRLGSRVPGAGENDPGFYGGGSPGFHSAGSRQSAEPGRPAGESENRTSTAHKVGSFVSVGNFQPIMMFSRFQPIFKRPLGLLCLGLLSAGLASCANMKEGLVQDPFLSAGPDEWADAGKTGEEKSDQGSAKSIAGIPLPVNSPEGPVLANHNQVRQVQQLVPADEAPAETVISAPCPPGLVVFPGQCPPAVIGVCPPVVPGWIGGAAIPPNPKLFPDEYLCDGGDRGYPVRYDVETRLGLETEDTVAEYTDHTGSLHVKPTNKVCVYAPRFGAMRSIGSPILETAVHKVASADKFTGGAGMRNQIVTARHRQNIAPGKYRTRERASDIDVGLRSSAVAQGQTVVSHTKLVNTFEDFQFVRSGLLAQTEEVRLAKGIQAAAAWSRSQFPVIAAQTEQAQEVLSEFRAQAVVGRESKQKPGRLRIVKMADKDVAQPGETITFTIRYDNLGELPLYKIRIIDNLTPRLGYVEDSETSDRAGRLLIQDNEEGSVILEFELDEPLPGGKGGVVTFQAKVR